MGKNTTIGTYQSKFDTKLRLIRHVLFSSSALRSMGGLIIGSGTINLFLRDSENSDRLIALLLANNITHTPGLLADVWGLDENIGGDVTIAGIFVVFKGCAESYC